jgi:tetratricopeptide (TPR) repeat protein
VFTGRISFLEKMIMEKLARKLMTISERDAGTGAPSAIFGNISAMPRSLLVRPPFRIGMFPCRSAEMPDAAMGLWAVVGCLLERWQDVQVYRLFARLEGEPEQYEWTPEKSQFDIDDFSIEPLDENIAIGAVLNKVSSGLELIVSVENDLLEDDDSTSTIRLEAASLNDLIHKLPELSQKIIDEIGAEQYDESSPVYQAGETVPDETVLINLLERLFDQELNLLLHAWGQSWSEEDLLEAQKELRDTGKTLASDFAAWAVASETARAMLPGFDLTVPLLDVVDDVSEEFKYSRQAAVILAAAVYRAGQPEDAYQMLVEETEAHPASTSAWLRLAALYGRSGRLADMIDTLQSAIEEDAINKAGYHQYTSALLAVDQYEQELEEFVLIDPDAVTDNLVLREAIAAAGEVLKLDASDKLALYRRALLLADLGDTDALVPAFRALVAADDTGSRLRDVVDAMHSLEDTTGIEKILREAVEQHPDRITLRTALAALLLLADEGEQAQSVLNEALAMTDDLGIKADIERLMLVADDPEFEQRFGELNTQIAAGRVPSNDEVDFLEGAVETAPSFVDACLALARAYILRDDREAAAEVLLDAQKSMPDNPDILAELGSVLWRTGEKELAFKYLNRGLQEHPNHIPLLVRIGRFLFDNGQTADARLYLSRAEAVDPLDTQLEGVRRYIAGRLAEGDYVPEEDED